LIVAHKKRTKTILIPPGAPSRSRKMLFSFLIDKPIDGPQSIFGSEADEPKAEIPSLKVVQGRAR
ncbi:MAG: hypothetical protein ACREA0_21010, partial [bacterium]